jgi:hypothetical protein
MKVKDLIKALETVDPEATVIITSSNFELRGAQIPVSYVHESKKGSKRIQGFRDAFDGDSYDKETWSTIGGEESVIVIS